MRCIIGALLGLLTICIAFTLGQYWLSGAQARGWSQELWQQMRHSPDATVDFALVGPADWQRVYIFGPYTPHERIDDALGFHWADAERTSIAYNDGVNLVVFARSGEVVGWFEHPRGRGDLVEIVNEVGYARDKAWFFVIRDREQRLVVVPPWPP
jgi:hypothetical protein